MPEAGQDMVVAYTQPCTTCRDGRLPAVPRLTLLTRHAAVLGSRLYSCCTKASLWHMHVKPADLAQGICAPCFPCRPCVGVPCLPAVGRRRALLGAHPPRASCAGGQLPQGPGAHSRQRRHHGTLQLLHQGSPAYAWAADVTRARAEAPGHTACETALPNACLQQTGA